jgi:hypothetical protein
MQKAAWAMFTMRAEPKIRENPMLGRAHTLPLMRSLMMISVTRAISPQ